MMYSFPKHCGVFTLAAMAASAILPSPNAYAAIHVGSSSWTWQNPLPQGNTLNAVSCPSSSACYIAGDLGTVLIGAIGSRTVTAGPQVTTQNLHGISCADTTNCVAVGDHGTVVTYGPELFCNPFDHICTTLYIWSPRQNTGISNVQLNAVSCASASICVAVGDVNEVFVTQNGGATWAPVPFGISSDFLTGISCVSTRVCWAVGPSINGAQGQVLEVFNSSGWKIVPWNSGDPTALSAISCAAARDCVAVDLKGNAAHTTNAPLDWSVTSVSGKSLFAISCVTGTQSCMAVGNANADGTNTVELTIDNGASWVGAEVNEGPPDAGFVGPLYGVSCTNFGGQCAGFMVGFSGAMATNPSSGFPFDIQSYYTSNNPMFFSRASCPADGICFAVGFKGAILATSNGGASWTEQASGTSQTLNAVSCPSTSVCYAAGANGAILKFTGTWGTESSGTTLNLTAISCPSTSVCIAGGPASSNSSTLFFTNNGGSTWTAVKTLSGTNLQLRGMSCVGAGPTTCDSVFLNGQILQTTTQSNGSTSNPTILANTPTQLNDISCPTLSRCTAVGGGGFIWSDQAGFWETQASGTKDDLTSVSCLPLSSGAQCVADSIQGHILFGTGATWTAQASLDQELFGLSCAGNAISSPQAYQCIGVGSNATIVSLATGSTGTHTLTPSHGNSEVGDPTTFQLTWTVPAGKVWRDLDHVDLKLTDDSGNTGLFARLSIGATASDPTTFAVLDGNGVVTGQGLPSSTGTIGTPKFNLDLANSSFLGTGPTGPTVTCNFTVSFRPAAAGNGNSDNAAHVYNVEVGAYDRTGNLSQLDTAGNWAVRQTHWPAN
jgi:photosystem II stability/assembly factor-like uncharacterized protein